MQAYIVVGESGEYSDYRMWIVAAYKDEDKAIEHSARANDFVKNNSESFENPHDEKMDTTFDVRYKVEAIPLLG